MRTLLLLLLITTRVAYRVDVNIRGIRRVIQECEIPSHVDCSDAKSFFFRDRRRLRARRRPIVFTCANALLLASVHRVDTYRLHTLHSGFHRPQFSFPSSSNSIPPERWMTWVSSTAMTMSEKCFAEGGTVSRTGRLVTSPGSYRRTPVVHAFGDVADPHETGG